MPQFNTVLTLPDAQATPVNHTFQPISNNGTVAIWAERLGGIVEGANPSISHSLTLAKGNNPSAASKHRIKVKVPVYAVGNDPLLGTVTTVRSQPLIDIVVNVTNDMTDIQRATLLKYATGFLTSAVMAAAVKNNESFF